MPRAERYRLPRRWCQREAVGPAAHLLDAVLAKLDSLGGERADEIVTAREKIQFALPAATGD